MLLAMWVAVLGVLSLGFGHLLEGGKQAGGMTSQPLIEGGGHVHLRAGRGGHYLAEGAINGTPVTFLLDTGASDVSIPGSLAKQLDLQPGRPVRYTTANGSIIAYRTRLDDVQLGPIRLYDVAGSINPHAEGPYVLLGMSFLGALELKQSNGTLTLTQTSP